MLSRHAKALWSWLMEQRKCGESNLGFLFMMCAQLLPFFGTVVNQLWLSFRRTLQVSTEQELRLWCPFHYNRKATLWHWKKLEMFAQKGVFLKNERNWMLKKILLSAAGLIFAFFCSKSSLERKSFECFIQLSRRCLSLFSDPEKALSLEDKTISINCHRN